MSTVVSSREQQTVNRKTFTCERYDYDACSRHPKNTRLARLCNPRGSSLTSIACLMKPTASPTVANVGLLYGTRKGITRMIGVPSCLSLCGTWRTSSRGTQWLFLMDLRLLEEKYLAITPSDGCSVGFIRLSATISPFK